MMIRRRTRHEDVIAMSTWKRLAGLAVIVLVLAACGGSGRNTVEQMAYDEAYEACKTGNISIDDVPDGQSPESYAEIYLGL